MAPESIAGGAVWIGEATRSFMARRSFRRFHPMGPWFKCPDCPAAVPKRKHIIDHRQLHENAGDYDETGDENGEWDDPDGPGNSDGSAGDPGQG